MLVENPNAFSNFGRQCTTSWGQDTSADSLGTVLIGCRVAWRTINSFHLHKEEIVTSKNAQRGKASWEMNVQQATRVTTFMSEFGAPLCNGTVETLTSLITAAFRNEEKQSNVAITAVHRKMVTYPCTASISHEHFHMWRCIYYLLSAEDTTPARLPTVHAKQRRNLQNKRSLDFPAFFQYATVRKGHCKHKNTQQT